MVYDVQDLKGYSRSVMQSKPPLQAFWDANANMSGCLWEVEDFHYGNSGSMLTIRTLGNVPVGYPDIPKTVTTHETINEREIVKQSYSASIGTAVSFLDPTTTDREKASYKRLFPNGVKAMKVVCHTYMTSQCIKVKHKDGYTYVTCRLDGVAFEPVG